MAKSQKRSTREPKKPKATVKKLAPVSSVLDETRSTPKKKPAASPQS